MGGEERMDKLSVKELWIKKIQEDDREYFSLKRIMRITGFSYGKIYYHINVLGILKGEQICKGGDILVSKEALIEYIEKMKRT